MTYVLLQNEKPIYINTKSLKEHPNVKFQTSDEVQSLENYENSFVVLDDLLLSKKASDIDLFFERRHHNTNDVNFTS